MSRSVRQLIGFSIVFMLTAGVGTLAPVSAASGHGRSARQRPHRHQVDRQKLDRHLRTSLDEGARGAQRVIIRTRSGAARTSLANQLAAHGDRVLGDFDSIGALTAVVHPEDLDALAAADDVVSVSSDAVVHAKLLGGLLGGLLQVVGGVVETLGDVVGSVLLPNGADTDGPAVAPEVLRETLGLSSYASGHGIGVAVIDSGLEMSPEFSGRVRGFYDFTHGGIATYPYDDYGHGTHVASTIGGSGELSYYNKYRGLAPEVTFTVLKVLDAHGAGYTSDVIRAIDFAVKYREYFGIDIINLSLGHPIYESAASDPLVQAVERAVRAGIVVVAAAGNYGKNPETGVPGYAGITSPGNAPSAITVGALRTEDTVSRRDDWIPDYSSRGPSWYDGFAKPDVVAPGHNIVAAAAKHGTFYHDYPQLKAADSDYIRMSGTSMATAVTTGVVALMLQANHDAHRYDPPLTPNAVKAMLEYSSFGVNNRSGAAYDPLTQGAGAINAAGAIQLARAADTSTSVGRYWLDSTPSPWTRIGGEYLPWQQSLVWGNVVIWGSSIIDVNQMAWGSVVIWGADSVTINGNVVIWGSNVVWDDPQSWANVVIWGADAIGQTDGEVVIWGATGGLSPETTAWGQLNGGESSGSSIKIQ